MKNIIIILTVFLSGAFISSPAFAKAEAKKKKDSPVTINADRMQYLKNENCMVLEDNVVVKLDSKSLYADKVIAFQGTNSLGKMDFTRIVATGNVVIKDSDKSLYGKKGVWEKSKNVIRFTGEPVVKTKGGQEISAEIIKYNVITGKVTFEGGSKAHITNLKNKNIDFGGF